MEKTLLRTNKEIEKIYELHIDMVYLVCSAYMKNPADTQDMAQNTFINLMKWRGEFQNAEHEKAWLLRTAINLCKNSLSHWWRKSTDIADYEHLASGNQFEIDETLQAIMNLPTRYKSVVILYYYEGYTTAEIAQMLKKPHSTIRYHLQEARRLLRDVLAEDRAPETSRSETDVLGKRSNNETCELFGLLLSENEQSGVCCDDERSAGK